MAFPPRRSSLGVVLALGAGSLLSLPVAAATITMAAVAFENSASVTDTEGGGATTYANVGLGSTSVSQFDPSLGVLMGVTVNLASTRAQSIQVSSTDGPDNGNNDPQTSKGTGVSTARITAPGISNTFTQISQAGSCSGNRVEACVGANLSSAAAPTNMTAVVAEADLDSYVGSGSVSASRTAPVLTATQGAPKFTGTESTTYTLGWSGTINPTYDYLLHAAPSFVGDSEVLTLDLDFGTVALGSGASLSFDIYNLAGLAGVDRVGLDLDEILGSGDTGKFFTGLEPFLGLTPGAGYGYSAVLDTSVTGSYSATFLLRLSDADVGAASSRFGGFELALNLMGSVVQPEADLRNSVPEPATLALFSLGIAAMPLVRRRKATV